MTTACQACVDAHCCAQLLTCDSIDAGGGPVVDDAGSTECVGAITCAVAYATSHPDAGLGPSDISTCATDVDGGTTTGGATALTVLTCVQTNCAAECNQ
jgi:hypothetical protein